MHRPKAATAVFGVLSHGGRRDAWSGGPGRLKSNRTALGRILGGIGGLSLNTPSCLEDVKRKCASTRWSVGSSGVAWADLDFVLGWRDGGGRPREEDEDKTLGRIEIELSEKNRKLVWKLFCYIFELIQRIFKFKPKFEPSQK
jgi:hypothetical protein